MRGVDVGTGFPGGTVLKNPPANAGATGESCVEKIPWRRKWQPTPVFWLGKFHGQRNLAGYSLGVKKSWTQLSTHTHTHTQTQIKFKYV